MNKLIMVAIVVALMIGAYYAYDHYNTTQRMKRRKGKRKAHAFMMKKAKKQRKTHKKQRKVKVMKQKSCDGQRMLKRSYVVSPVMGI